MATTVISGSSSISTKTLTDVLVSGYSAQLYVRGGGRVVSATAINSGSIRLYSGGKCDSSTLSGNGYLYIYSGSASKVTISSGGHIQIAGDGSNSSSIAEAYLTTINPGGVMYLQKGGTASNTDVMNGGRIILGSHVSSEGRYAYNYAQETYISGGSMEIQSGSFASRTYIHGGSLYISSGGSATSNHVFESAFLTVSGGTAISSFISSGGTMTVLNKGKALVGKITSGGFMIVSSGGSASGITMKDGSFGVSSGGTASDTVMSNGVYFLAGESYKGTFLSGLVWINPGGYSNNETFSGGTLHLLSSGSASASVYNATIGSGVSANVIGGRLGGTTISNAIINMSGGNVDLKNLNGAVASIKGGVFYASGGIMSSAVVSGLGSAMGKMAVWSGTTVENVDVNANGHLAIMSGASVTSAYAGRTSGSDSASIGVSGGGRLGSALVLGILDIGSGGSVTSAVFSSGGKGIVSGLLGRAVVGSGCPLQVSSGGYVDAATVSSGGRINVNGGTLGYANVAGKGTLSLASSGSAASATIFGSALVSSTGYLAGTTVSSGGQVYVYGSGTAVGTAVRSGGSVIVQSGGLFAGSAGAGGIISVLSGGYAGLCTVSSGGTIKCSSGASVTFSLIDNGGKITGAYNCSSLVFSSGGIADFDISGRAAGNTSAFVSQLGEAMSQSPLFTLTVNGTQANGKYKLASGAAGFNRTVTVKNTSGATLGTLKVGQTTKIGGTDYKLELGGDNVLSVSVSAAAPAPASTKSDINGNGVSDVMFQLVKGDYGFGQIGFWLDGTNTWQSEMAVHPTDSWNVLGAYDMNANGKADAVLVGNIVMPVGGIDLPMYVIGYYTDSVDLDANWNNISYLGNPDLNVWNNEVGNLTGNAGMNSIVWHSTDLGVLGVWTDGTDNWVSLGAGYNSSWEMVGCGDFDGDGKDSVLMAFQGAAYYTVDIVGAEGAANPLTTSDSNWAVSAIGDFSGDGKDDIIAYNASASLVAMWGDGDATNKWSLLGMLDKNDWFIVGAGDYNGDAKDDLLVRQNSTGMLGYYTSGNMEQWVELGRGVDMNWSVIA